MARRISQFKRTFTSFRPLSSFWLCDVIALLVFTVSLVFVVINGMLTFGVGTTMSHTCDASVVMCVTIFVLTKVLLYLYYLERLWLVQYAKTSSNTGEPHILARFRCYPWLAGIAIFVFGVPCAILLGFSKDFDLIYRSGDVSMIEAVGCHVFLKWYLATPIIVWAAIINAYILGAFAYPLIKNRLSARSELRPLTKATIWAGLISGVSTVINLSVLLILKGEHGLECLLCCSIDVVVNSLALSCITSKLGEVASFPSLVAYGTVSVAEYANRDKSDDSTDPAGSAEYIKHISSQGSSTYAPEVAGDGEGKLPA